MADICDITDEVLEAEIAAARIENAAKLAANRLKPMGRCYYCDTELSNPNQIFCDKDCSEGHQLEQKMKKITGA